MESKQLFPGVKVLKNSELSLETTKKQVLADQSSSNPQNQIPNICHKQNSISLFQPSQNPKSTQYSASPSRIQQIRRKRSQLNRKLLYLEQQQRRYQQIQKYKQYQQQNRNKRKYQIRNTNSKQDNEFKIDAIASLMKNYKKFQRQISQKSNQYEENLMNIKREIAQQEIRIKQASRNKRLQISQQNLRILKKREEIRKQNHQYTNKQLLNIKNNKPLYEVMNEKWQKNQQKMNQEKENQMKLIKQNRNNGLYEIGNHQKHQNNIQQQNSIKRQQKRIQRTNISSLHFQPNLQQKIKNQDQNNQQLKHYKNSLPKIFKQRIEEYSFKIKEQNRPALKNIIQSQQNTAIFKKKTKSIRTLSFNQKFSQKNPDIGSISQKLEFDERTIHTTDNNEKQNTQSTCHQSLQAQNQIRNKPLRRIKMPKLKQNHDFVDNIVQAITSHSDKHPSKKILKARQQPNQIYQKCIRYKTQQQNLTASAEAKCQY